jgi:NAD+ kinase
MSESKIELNNIAVAVHPRVTQANQEANRIKKYFQDNGIKAETFPLFDPILNEKLDAKEYDLLVALGGDGTMLRAGHICGPVGVPILGINMGRFGFLIELNEKSWERIFPSLLTGDYWIEHRMMLRAEQWRENECLGKWDVLNEIVVSRGHTVRPIHLEASVDGRFLSTYVADGLIASTATGSTAYALAAGGPILPPELRNILLVAVAPHLSIDRAIVLAEGSTVHIVVNTNHEAVLSPDGQPSIYLEDGDLIVAYASDHSCKFLRFQDPGYFYRNLTPHMNQNPSTGNTR